MEVRLLSTRIEAAGNGGPTRIAEHSLENLSQPGFLAMRGDGALEESQPLDDADVFVDHVSPAIKDPQVRRGPMLTLELLRIAHPRREVRPHRARRLSSGNRSGLARSAFHGPFSPMQPAQRL
jgi:hypothetical protein